MAAAPSIDREPNKLGSFNQANENTSSYLSVPEFYRDRSVFITGGTGFMGKVS